MCVFQLSLVSKFSPRYFTVWFCDVHGIVCLFICNGGGWANGLRENILAVDLLGLSLIFHNVDQLSILFR